MCGDGVEQALGDFVRIGVEEADPLFGRGLDLGEAGEQIGEAVREPQIFAVAGGVLADQVDFADALLEEAGGLGDDGFEAPAAEGAAILGDHAEGAGMIAALGDLHVGEVARGGENARGEVVIEVGLQGVGIRFQPFADGDDAFQFVGADEGVDFGQFLADIAAVAFDQAAGDDQFAGAADFLVLGHLEDGVDRFLLGGVNEAAGVDDEYVGLIGMGGEFVAFGDELPHHDFTIDEVFGTAQTDETDFQDCVPTLREDLPSG